ncbi:HAMP domain-containing histidine kinase [Streptomyces sp. TRM66268-LWL]|uniref:histidine kinase n=1 Tax=Streptomyces polyasparticus TaxID=2767826 RepID=A0ABR7SUK8_9ACTN|nr:HAMP domain-containing sensor histidine kinase [Streptomyces polyasparticus]MBC9719182.1 HAMP domain-containing histidine kinase [Streptomyces polyasparticus]
MIRRFRALPLRSRLGLLVATAVAVAVAAVAAACWWLTRDQLRNQMDDTLRSMNVSQQIVDLRVCRQEAPQTPDGDVRPFVSNLNASVQLSFPDGSHCWVDGTKSLPVTGKDLGVFEDGKPVMYDGTATDGTKMRVYTEPTRFLYNDQPVAVTVAKPLSDVTEPLNTLAMVLLAVFGLGVVGAGAAGLVVARTGLKPVDDLADTVEHVARTEDLTVRIPADGDDEIARLSRSFNAMTAALESSQERQAQLIADAGHELRTPLTSLRTNIELLARSEETGRAIPPDDRKALLASVKAQMTELASLIGDLQELARPDTNQAAKVEVVGFHKIAQTAVDRARLRGPELTIDAELAPWYVRADAAALERALVNVLDNAVKFSPPNGTVEVALDRGTLTVRDHGPGIPAEELPYVFDRFWRSPTARQLPGSGLGLSIVARTVQHCGGEVALRAAEGGGTVAVVKLPGAPTPPPDSR